MNIIIYVFNNMGDPLIDTVFFLHKILIVCSIYIATFFTYLLYTYLCVLFGFHIIFEIEENSSAIGKNSCAFIYKIALFIVFCLLVLLFWIFIFWMIIILFVPYVIIIPIPIFPFIFIIPLKTLMLELIPPFKTLTDTGTLPLMYRLISRLFSEQTVSNFINYYLFPSISDIGNYLYYNTNELVREISGHNIDEYFIQDRFKNNNHDDVMKNVESNDKQEDINKYNEYKETPTIKAGMKRIEEDTELCINMRQKFKPYNSSYLSDVEIDMDNSFSPYNECYTQAIKSYLKTSIR